MYRLLAGSSNKKKPPKGKDYDRGEGKKETGRDNNNNDDSAIAASRATTTITTGATSAKEVSFLSSSPLPLPLPSSSLSPSLSLSSSSSCLSPSQCYHGSSFEQFHNREYAVCVQAYLDMRYDCLQQYRKDMSRKGLLQIASRKEKFDEEYDHFWNKNDVFCRFLFAYCVHLYLTKGHHNKKDQKMIQTLLSLGIDMLYGELSESEVEVNEETIGTTELQFGPGSINYEKNCKYNRDITNERGLINCLARETAGYCQCMTPYKIEANKKMSETTTTTTTTTRDGSRVTTMVPTMVIKVGTCFGCQQDFPKHTLSFCTGCHIHQYCGKRCQTEHWPHHKVFCKMVQAANSSSTSKSSSSSKRELG